MTLSLKEATVKDEQTLTNLYSLYLHDLSAYTDSIKLSEEGTFQFDGIPSFWTTEGIRPYFITFHEEIIGFLLLLERPFLKKDNDYGINDLFILNRFKGKGLGKQAIHLLLQQKKGKYFVIELMENEPAVAFWKNIYREFQLDFEERRELVDEEDCLIQTFTVS
ncbi:GNAT family N-acetyltransferase [Sutcliffiella horikoshii]|uniref:GNAT family N-acetyltransferase n=1 Tax=Sutcliffiella horikoshii TaxID=79883 RepID=UPI00203A5003|nr:GNAT family N-acetyltransferase [Sutcliffiella horikoshii]MCM3620295.1 GNAT family N-acetyltransferase [Sutcliffiella horikoshii]